jgi:hypothetical protein
VVAVLPTPPFWFVKEVGEDEVAKLSYIKEEMQEILFE